MGGSSGGSRPQQVSSTVTQTNLPAYVQPYYEDVLDRGLFESARPYQTYGGQRLAQFSPEETGAQRGLMGLKSPYQFQAASNIAGRIGAQGPAGFSAAQRFNPNAVKTSYRGTKFNPGYQARQFSNTFDPGSLADSGAIARYMSPYQQAVTDIEKREAMRASVANQMNINSQAARYGATGGNRSAILESERQRNLQQQLGDIQSRGSQDAFAQAAKAFEVDRQGRIASAEFDANEFRTNEEARLNASKMGLQAQELSDRSRKQAQEFRTSADELNINTQKARAELALRGLEYDSSTGLGVADRLRDLGATEQKANMERIAAQGAIGASRTGLMQRGLDIGYEDFVRQQAYPQNQLGYMSSLLHGMQIVPDSSKATYGNVPSSGQKALGSGLNALGLWQAFNQS